MNIAPIAPIRLGLARGLMLLGLGICGLPLACSNQDKPQDPVLAPGTTKALDFAELPKWLAGSKLRFAVDLRDPQTFARSHVRGAVNLQSGYAQFELRAARFFPEGSQLAILAEDPALAEKTARSIARQFPGTRYFNERVSRLAELGVPLATQKTIGIKEASGLLHRGKALFIDTRTAAEYAAGHAPGAVFIYPDDFARQIGFLRPDKTIIVVCEEGWRSSLLVSYLDRFGFRDARNLITGMKAWRAAGLPLEKGSEQRAFK